MPSLMEQPNSAIIDRYSELESACKSGDLATAESILSPLGDEEQFVAVNSSPDDGKKTLLHWAAMQCHVDVACFLLSMGADIDAEDANAHTPLHRACINGHTAIVELLLNMGANTRALALSAKLALHLACQHGHLALASLLIHKDPATLRMADEYGRTPLHLACCHGHLAVAELLVRKGADITAMNEDCQVAFALCPNGEMQRHLEAIVAQAQLSEQQHPQAQGVPQECICPLTMQLMSDPVLAEDGIVYDREAIATWLRQTGMSPMTRQAIGNSLKPVLMVKNMVDKYLAASQ
eukprot:TRINITY_DN12551_c0_g1_i5.p1 TRINITY_DN12551_c0_g1~~TRINITY_DN12551_c0_g1_i5.p1  ORF type:complete len:294 (+),score=69.91 TRINITY_DN12551_c0_g1_i5:161-1042(+)